MLGDGSVVPLELVLALGEYDGEPERAADRAGAASATTGSSPRELEAAVQHRSGHRPADAPPSARRAAGAAASSRSPAACATWRACGRTNSRGIERDLGVLASEQFLIAFANIVRSLLGPHDIAGHFGGTTLLLLLERGNARDVEAWCENLVERVGKHMFQIGQPHACTPTCTVGVGRGAASTTPTSTPPSWMRSMRCAAAASAAATRS